MAVLAVTGIGVVVDDELYRLLNTVANLGTVALLLWHQRHVRKQLEPKVDKVEAIVTRSLDERDPSTPDTWNGKERRSEHS